MTRRTINACILRVGGTNCDIETKRAFDNLDVRTEIVHMNKIVQEKNLFDYHVLIFPGGFSYGDYIRAGAIWGKRFLSKLGDELRRFVKEGRLVLGICNGFQVLVEAGLLPGFDGISEMPKAALAPNTSIKYECRWIYLKHENSGNCIFTKKIPRGKIMSMPIGHAEGRFIFSKEHENQYLKKLYENDQLVFRYCTENGEYAKGRYPINPNGSLHDIAGICNLNGNVFGLMPHPERAFYGWQHPDWTSRLGLEEYGDGRLIFESMLEYVTIEKML
jgi:phosphoribosylformylglycinamidine synthase